MFQAAAPARSQSRGSAKENSAAREQDKRGRDSRTKRRAASRVSPMAEAAAPSCTDHHTSMLDTKRKQRQEGSRRSVPPSSPPVLTRTFSTALPDSLARFRWIVPAHREVLLKIWFYSEHPGTFSHTFNFELMGTGRLYQLPCRGICTYPSICSNYMCVPDGVSRMTSDMIDGLISQSPAVFSGLCFPPAKRLKSCRRSWRRRT